VIPKKPVPDLIRDGCRLSEKITPKQENSDEADSTQLNQPPARARVIDCAAPPTRRRFFRVS
jgi:hypothetical protein